MSMPKAWYTLPSLEINPKKTFFGVDKNASYCFTLPKAVYEKYVIYFELKDNRLQERIIFEVDGNHCRADIRLIMIDRSRPYKLKSEDLPKRKVLQFQWKKYDETKNAIISNNKNPPESE